MSDYWLNCIDSAFDEAGIVATLAQREQVAADVKTSFELYNEYTGEYLIPDPREETIERLKKQLATELRKIVCPECRGSGNEYSYGPSFTAISSCYRCGGTGKVLP